MKNKVVFITGAAGAIGFEIAKQFAQNGATVVMSDTDAKKLEDATATLGSRDLKILGIQADLTCENQIKDALDETYKRYGSIDILVNNAGLQHISSIEDFPTDKFELLIKVMLVAPFITTKHVFPIMKAKKFGRIINMASVNGLVGFAGKAAYNSAKHGIIGLTKVTALEGAPFNITANALCPGYVDTDLVRNQLSALAKTRNISIDKVLDEVIYPLVPQKRLLAVDEIANYVLFLSGEKALGITGQAVVIDGGYTAQ
ncbi:MAG TPA: 3-hydroxybutyrate dehydrogenase [Nitrosopumilaceae archaeon]|jgi:3-hydroxybutyrate dehydrogenase|nr:3-hydroxybutyrate dehydrogenase [Nitrosopumilaceae archaeon]